MTDDELRKLPLVKNNHLTDLAISILIDNEASPTHAEVMRRHIGKCEWCRSRMAKYMRVDHETNPQG